MANAELPPLVSCPVRGSQYASWLRHVLLVSLQNLCSPSSTMFSYLTVILCWFADQIEPRILRDAINLGHLDPFVTIGRTYCFDDHVTNETLIFDTSSLWRFQRFFIERNNRWVCEKYRSFNMQFTNKLSFCFVSKKPVTRTKVKIDVYILNFSRKESAILFWKKGKRNEVFNNRKSYSLNFFVIFVVACVFCIFYRSYSSILTTRFLLYFDNKFYKSNDVQSESFDLR